MSTWIAYPRAICDGTTTNLYCNDLAGNINHYALTVGGGIASGPTQVLSDAYDCSVEFDGTDYVLTYQSKTGGTNGASNGIYRASSSSADSGFAGSFLFNPGYDSSDGIMTLGGKVLFTGMTGEHPAASTSEPLLALSMVSDSWIDALATYTTSDATWAGPITLTAGASGYGASEAPRGALAHFQTINVQGKITAHQAVVPTTWNAAPKDATADYTAGPTGLGRGPMEQAMIGIPFDDKSTTYDPIGGGAAVVAQSGIEALRVAHTFDPCIACAVH
jgi:hypothetical protein